jgi:uncharacterized OsmC-like protein
MDIEALRAAQAPLKARYRADPASAVTPLSATGDFRDAGATCTVDGWAGAVRAGLHPATGGDGRDACSGDLLLEALVACAGVTLRSVATAMGIEVGSAHLTARATFDARGTLGVDRSVPVGISGTVIEAELTCAADEATLARLAAATERFCVVGQSLAEPPRIVVTARRP